MRDTAREPGDDVVLNLDLLVRATGATVLARGPERFTGAFIDGRAVVPGGLWFAIRGERFDGHDFAAQAIASGAAGLVIARERAAGFAIPPGVTVVAVDDTVRALGDYARAWRMGFPSLKVVGVAGSNGKTTTKEMVAAILAAAAGPLSVHKTDGNLNNHLGVPLTLLRLAPAHRYAVVEMGMSGLGELAYLAELARPDVAVVTSIGPEHLEMLHTVENVARAEGEIFAALGPAAVAVTPDDEPLIAPFAAASRALWRLRFGVAPGVPVRIVRADARPTGTDLELRLPDGSAVATRLAMVGAHNASNAAAAAACAWALGIPGEAIGRGLALARTAKHRSTLVEVGGRHVIDDCYNASPPSVNAALEALSAFARQSGSRAVAVLGDMLELGGNEDLLHREVGARAVRVGIDELIAVGPRARHFVEGALTAGLPRSRAHHVDTVEQAVSLAASATAPGDYLLVKASRGGRLERVIDGLAAHLAAPQQGTG